MLCEYISSLVKNNVIHQHLYRFNLRRPYLLWRLKTGQAEELGGKWRKFYT